MADDIFLTAEEQDERARQWLKDNGLALIVGISLGLAAVFGYNQYKDSVQASAEQASALYDAVLTIVDESKISDIDAQVMALKSDYAGSPYASKAVLLKANQVAVNDLEAALVELEWVVDNAPEIGLKHTALIRQAKIQLALGELDLAREIASKKPYNGFDSHYHEILGDIDRKQGNVVDAKAHYEQALEKLATTDSVYAQVLTLKLERLPEVASNAVEAE